NNACIASRKLLAFRTVHSRSRRLPDFFLFRRKILDQLLDFVAGQSIAEGGHLFAAVVYLLFDLRPMKMPSHSTQIGTFVGADAVDAMTVLATFLVEHGRALFAHGF